MKYFNVCVEFFCFQQVKNEKKKRRTSVGLRDQYIVYETANDVFYVPVISERAVQYARQFRRVLSDAASAI